MSGYSNVVMRLFSKPTPFQGAGKSRGLIKRFGGVPSPHGDFSHNHIAISALNNIQATPYGFESSGENSSFDLDLKGCGSETRLVKASVQFTSYPLPLAPKLVVSCEGHPQLIVAMPVLQSGRCEALFTAPGVINSVKLYPDSRPALFAFHSLVLEALSPKQAAQLAVSESGRKYDVLVFPVIDWEYRYQRPQQLASQFAQDLHRVFYLSVGFIGLHRQDIEERPLAEGVTGLRLPGNLRYNIYRDSASANSVEVGVRLLEKYLLERDCNNVVMVVDLPFWLPYAKILRERFGWPIVYDCMDDHAGFENNTEKMLCLEDDMTRSADLLVVSSDLLERNKSPLNKNHVLIRNGADYEHFSQEIPREQSPIAHIPGPIIGYYGAVAEWFDVESLRLAVHAHPEWSFVIIGHVDKGCLGIKELEECSNVHFIGEIPYAQLPGYLAAFDICTIPFKRIPLTEATNPVKVYEYLSAGKPVVARELPELIPLRDHVQLYSTSFEFVAELEKGVKGLGAVDTAARQAIARENTWNGRYLTLSKKIDQLFPKVSIIIISFHQMNLTFDCVRSIFKNTQYPNYEVVLIDNGSGPDVVEFIEALGGADKDRVRAVVNGANRGFAGGNNVGLELCKNSDFFVLLNNDTVVPRNWLERLLWHAAKPDIGIVGPVSNSVGNEAQIPVDYRNAEQMVNFSRSLCLAHLHETFDIKTLAMFCVAFRREVLQKVGFLEECYSVGMFEDDDYAERVRAAGLRVICAEDSFVHHIGSASFSKLAKPEYKEIFERNKALFESKWGPWIPHQYR